jgi:hypothetical protein
MVRRILSIILIVMVMVTGSIEAAQRYETTHVNHAIFNGLDVQVAQYIDGTAVYTSFDGPTKGMQEVYFNGACVSGGYGSWEVDHFTHYYQYGRIVSYRNKQIIELY